MAERTAQRRFLALKVGEVSLVDSPANEEEFIVLKRREPEEKTMADTKKNETPAPAATETVTKGAETPEVVPVEVAKAQDEGAKSALAAVEKMVSDIAKLVGAAAPAETEVEKADKAAKAKKDKMAAMRKKLGDAGMKGAALEKAMEAYAAQDDEDGDEQMSKKAEETEKAKKAADEEGGDDVSKMLETLASAVQKAKTFTPKREAALKAVVADLQKLLEDMTVVPTHTSPKTSTPGITTPMNSGLFEITKKMEEMVSTIKSSLGTVETTTKGLNDRLEAIEKARNPSQSVTPEGKTDTKTQKSFWTGVL